MNGRTKVLTACLMTVAMVFAVGCTKPEDPNYHGNNVHENDSVVNDTVLVVDGDSLVIHDFVDLGLPSGVLWATCNLGAEKPEDFGDYYAWGETRPKDTYYWRDYQYGDFVDDHYAFTKYCTDSSYGSEGFVDNLTHLDTVDDAVVACWGKDWRMPTKMDWEELLSNTTSAWTVYQGVEGWLFKGLNGNSLFLPAAGFAWDSQFSYDGLGLYWSNTLNKEFPNRGWGFYFNVDQCHVCGSRDRNCGLPIRAVCSRQ